MALSRMHDFKTVADYIAAQPEELQPKLGKIRQTIRKAAPNAEESISYGMPAYKLHGPLVYFACFKNHFGFFPTPSAVAAFRTELAGYEIAKGTVRLPHKQAVPVKLIATMVKFKAKENEEKAALKATLKKVKVA